MKKLSFYFLLCVVLLLGIILVQAPLLQAIAPPQDATIVSGQSNMESEDEASASMSSFDEAVKNAETLPGLFTLYRHKQNGKILLEIKPEQLDKNYLATITLASGIGEQWLYSGIPLPTFLFYFRRVNNNLLFTVRNVNFRANPNDSQRLSVERSFSDSVLDSLKIISIHPQRRTMLVDLGNLLLKDLPGLKSLLRKTLQVRYELDGSKSYFGTTGGFPLNVEIDAIYGFTLSDGENEPDLPTLPDSRALSLRVHYSFSQLPENNNYRPRLADERVGYYYTTYKDFSGDNQPDPFVRYINRWHLEKQDPSATISPPKKPIVFWIENTVPLEYREAIREGVLMWNQAFEKAGFKDALSVQQMPDNAPWNPADVRYNTIRWLNSLDAAFFGIGPSRVNPLTGEILDADIVVDGDLVRSQKQDYRTFVENQRSANANLTNPPRDMTQANYQLAIGEIALPLVQTKPNEMKQFIHQFWRWVVAHEVGHALGLRHNFRASTLLKPEELNNTNITRTKGMVSSVMDYVPVNLAPIGTPQGDYFPVIVGAYDEWAIEYGYKPSTATTTLASKPFLQQIANRQANNPELSYAPDEDVYDLDPTVNTYDLSSDPLRYSQLQLDNARVLWDRLNRRPPSADEGYSELRESFDQILFYYWRQVYFISKYIGGQSFYRVRPNAQNQPLPFVPVPASKQREALTVLQKYLFAADAFNFPPELLNKLAPSRWNDLGNEAVMNRLDYPIHDRIFFFQSYFLSILLSGDRLSRLRDLELKAPPGESLTMPELFNTLQAGIWTELEEMVKISSWRRALQREHLRLLINMVLRTESVPEDARTLAWSKLRQLRSESDRTLRKQGKNLDEYTIAHLAETRDRITKVLDAPLQSKHKKTL
ncbi:zinc-dependent metalloprotease [Microseira wollei]|uniref:DUF5117 domain-containing protein n=1 Tax=Microseira wollei NIES-4236 TaxID=2530354 RepID=A0AAV3XBP4_9CYAN|nr:zinc-dependent metalloprotease [Microseira wollei]GET39245.1 hypothetical protein MiSe_40090 [Microseira wollei NIES-4236]